MSDLSDIADGPTEADVLLIERQLEHLSRQPLNVPTRLAVTERVLERRRRRSMAKRGCFALVALTTVGSMVGVLSLRPSTTVVVVTDVANSGTANTGSANTGSATARDETSSDAGSSASEALVAAVQEGDEELVLVLLESGLTPDQPGRFGLTPLMIAALRDDATIVAALVDYDADVELVAESGDTALHLAAGFAGPETVAALLDGGAAVDARNPDRNDRTALMRAVGAGRLDVVDVMLAAGADPNALDDRSRSVLHYALDSDNTDAIVERLMSVGATWLHRNDGRVATKGRPVADVVAELTESD